MRPSIKTGIVLDYIRTFFLPDLDILRDLAEFAAEVTVPSQDFSQRTSTDQVAFPRDKPCSKSETPSTADNDFPPSPLILP
jgi:hypothetical protein